MEDLSSCFLCEKRAMMMCDSDQAKLCWDCDEKVHSANFLVAKHSRVLLCRLCHSPTPWKASGTRLARTVSFCHRCVADRNRHQHHRRRGFAEDHGGEEPHGASDDHVSDEDDSDDYTDESGEEEVDDDDGEGENQVVPMSFDSPTSPPSDGGLALKLLQNNSFLVDSSLHDEMACSSSETTLPSGVMNQPL